MSDDEIDDGGTAFPAEGIASLGSRYCTPGMSLRDWFAGQAMVLVDAELPVDQFAKQTYIIADAMLRERAKHDDK